MRPLAPPPALGEGAGGRGLALDPSPTPPLKREGSKMGRLAATGPVILGQIVCVVARALQARCSLVARSLQVSLQEWPSRCKGVWVFAINEIAAGEMNPPGPDEPGPGPACPWARLRRHPALDSLVVIK